MGPVSMELPGEPARHCKVHNGLSKSWNKSRESLINVDLIIATVITGV